MSFVGPQIRRKGGNTDIHQEGTCNAREGKQNGKNLLCDTSLSRRYAALGVEPKYGGTHSGVVKDSKRLWAYGAAQLQSESSNRCENPNKRRHSGRSTRIDVGGGNQGVMRK